MRVISKKECTHCGKMIGATAFNRHVAACKAGRIPSIGPKDSAGRTAKWREAQRNKKGGNQYTKARELGLPKPEISDETREKLRKHARSRSKEWHRENGKKVSRTIQRKVKEGTWHTSVAKRMHCQYRNVTLHGRWELAYAMYLDREGIAWKRPFDRFAYEYEERVRYYTPDFYLPDSETFVEIKGYETAKDTAKWTQFNQKLIVLKFRELKELVSKYPEISDLVHS